MIAASSGGSSFFFIIIIAFALLWLLVVRPQKKRQNAQRALLNELTVGDEVLTAGGIYGTITQLDDEAVTVEIAPNTKVRVARRAIAGVTRDDEVADEETGEPGEPQEDDDHEKWQSAFDEDDAGAGEAASNEGKRG